MEGSAHIMSRSAAAGGGWVAVSPAAARRHALFGVRGLMLAVLAGWLWCAAVSAYRLFLLVSSLLGWQGELAPADAVLTFMPVADLAFAVLFVALAVQSLRPLRDTMPDNGVMLCGLYVLYVIPYVAAFRHLTQTAAFSFSAPATYIHYVLPVLFCLMTIAYLRLSRRVGVTYRARVRPGDQAAGS